MPVGSTNEIGMNKMVFGMSVRQRVVVFAVCNGSSGFLMCLVILLELYNFVPSPMKFSMIHSGTGN